MIGYVLRLLSGCAAEYLVATGGAANVQNYGTGRTEPSLVRHPDKFSPTQNLGTAGVCNVNQLDR